jgi:hypothetical protein
MLHVRGGDSAIHTIQHICDQSGWRAIDTSTGDFINFTKDPAEGLRQWRTFRNQVVASLEAGGKEVVTDAKVGMVWVDAIEVAKPKKKKWWQFRK